MIRFLIYQRHFSLLPVDASSTSNNYAMLEYLIPKSFYLISS